MLNKCSEFFIIQNFYVNFQNFSLTLHKFSIYFFGKLPTIAGHRITRVYSKPIPSKLGIIYG